jgi:hypothetical protein
MFATALRVSPKKNVRKNRERHIIWQASITASATFGHSASPGNVTCWHIMALQ